MMLHSVPEGLAQTVNVIFLWPAATFRSLSHYEKNSLYWNIMSDKLSQTRGNENVSEIVVVVVVVVVVVAVAAAAAAAAAALERCYVNTTTETRLAEGNSHWHASVNARYIKLQQKQIHKLLQSRHRTC